ncbi:hypothetical protein E6O75_ATG00359 [Venturia nashicola]|uniref:Uncharacterized protein n=1 Tax=Venturia nashicola TaxID=86259 RepID=A0A4Z1PWM3_9PEZI|nr:hypothetical protein E6O75_ATG00359 [Venturia nashicola]
MAASQTSQQLPTYYSPCHGLQDSQLVAGMGSLFVSGQPQGQSMTPVSSPHSGHALQQIQQPQIQDNHYALQHYGQPYGAHRQGQVQSWVSTSQPIQHSNCVPVPVTHSTSFYPVQSETGYYRQQPVGHNSPDVDHANTGNAAAPPYTSHAQNHHPGYGDPVASLQKQNAPSPQSPLLSTVSNSVLNTPATTVNSMASPSSNTIPSAFQPNQIQYVHQTQQSLVTSQPIPAVQPYQPQSTMPQPPDLNHAHPSQNTVLYQTSAGQLSSQNSMPSQQAPVPSQYQPSQAVQIAMQQRNNHQHQVSNRPHVVQAGVQHQNTQHIQTQYQTQALMSDTQHQSIQHHQNTVPSETVQGAQHTTQTWPQSKGHAPVHQYQPAQVPTEINQQPIQQQVQTQGQQRTQYQTQPQHIQQQYQNTINHKGSLYINLINLTNPIHYQLLNSCRKM